ncbi:MAG: TetR/AcrR family transcriptional regulator [Patulibacter minatonensis]
MSAGDATGDRSPRSRAGTRTRIIDAAASLYLAQGEANTTIEEIAAKAGMSASSVYRYFGGKRAVEDAMIDEALSQAESYLGAARRAPSPMERVRGAGVAYFRVAVEYPVAMRFFAARSLRDGGEHSERFDRAVTVRTREMIISVAADLRQAMDTGEIPPGRVADVLLFLWGSWSGVITAMVRRDDLAVDAESAARALDLGQYALSAALTRAGLEPGAAGPEPTPEAMPWARISPAPDPSGGRR